MLTPIQYHKSEDAEFTCAACGRHLKRAVTLSDGLLRGLDCAHVLLYGRKGSKSQYWELEKAARMTAAKEYTLSWLVVIGTLPVYRSPEWKELQRLCLDTCPWEQYSVEHFAVQEVFSEPENFAEKVKNVPIPS